MFYGAGLAGLFRHAAVYVDKILRGAKPGDLPIEQPTEVTLQLPEKRDEGAVGVRAGLRVKEEACASAIPPEGQRRRHRQPLPGAADMSQDGRVAPRGPRAADDGLLREPAFVLEDEPRAAPLGVFFSCVQRRVFQRVIAASSRSRARRAGRWSDQPNRRSSRQTWLGWCRMPVSRSMTWAMRGSVHRSVLNPCRPGPARSAWSTFASSVAPNRGRRPARPAPFNPVRPLFFHAWCQRPPHSDPPGSGKLSHPGSAIGSHPVERDRIPFSFSPSPEILAGALQLQEVTSGGTEESGDRHP